ncbi:alpha-N-acetylglucosaminidase C-terminal domain-containing protein [Streptomyces sp. 71268]|uniref:alpha-N-acetylglucosaminidase n=1 Tax=Streptomyces sp. 71268 TaxID=3002640 RepID=UPI0023F69E4E|nr:alpha-N-acetylglucosaminidase TIM-barrel domain-containing protein [Streptomyces sp. 71268]WEV28187.1 alpha-N-acetylglucosaminidase C-terminal domain-containing protein [Streptomyces sp. 71268]
MSDLTRRTVLGTAGAIGVTAALAAHGSGASAAPHAGAGAARDGKPYSLAPARAALARLLPDHVDQFRLRLLADGPGRGAGQRPAGRHDRDRRERFTVTGSTGRVEVAGTSPAVILTGVHWYLKYTCRAHLSWSGNQLDLPQRLPAPREPLRRSTALPHRFAFNDTHDGYTSPYADWDRWERMIDLLALHGCNEVLITAGQEAVYHRFLQEFGYSDTELRTWLPAPSHQPWWMLQNMSEYAGPVSPELLAKRTELGQRIADRLRELGMSPIFPGYFGTVPGGFAERNPGGRTIEQGTWNGLPRPEWLDPRTPVFERVAASFYRHQEELFGPAVGYKMDLLHEGGNPGDVPVADAARAVQKALAAARPEAVWVILGWQENPRRELLNAVDKSRLLVVDGLSDLERIGDREQDWGGTPYAFGTIPNFGGRTTIGAKTHMWADRFTVWRDKPDSALVGTAYMPEAAERDPAAFELFSELAWRDAAVDRTAWFREYADARYGGRDRHAHEAFDALRESAYEISSADGRPHDSIFAARPNLGARSGTYYATREPAFDLAVFDTAFAALLGVRPALRGSDAYRYDITDLGRQVLANRSWQLQPQLKSAYQRGDLAAFRALSRLWLRLMELSEEMSAAHRGFLLGPWLEDAKRMASSEAEQVQLEHSARALITTWADRATADTGRLANYGNRDWQGLIGDFHLPQWRLYLDELEDALAEGREPKTFDWYTIEEPWTRERKSYPQRPTRDAYRTASRVREVLARAPYQGAIEVSADPTALEPGGNALVTVDFHNINGLAPTGRVDFRLTGPDATPQGPTSVPSVPAAGHVAAHWRVTAPSTPLTAPLEPLPYELSTAYGPRGEERITDVRRGTLHVAGPLEAGLRTVTTNDAVFGQLGDRYAIAGGGRDLWKATAEFGAVYRPRSLATGGAVSVRVTQQPATGPWARAGIIVRDDLSTAGSPGFLNLAVTPGNGVVLSYDANGDGTVDTYRRVTGVRAPVLLRLTREPSGAYTGALSTDDGATWRTVGTVSVPGAADRQDAGLFMTATHGGSGAHGLVDFADWQTR